MTVLSSSLAIAAAAHMTIAAWLGWALFHHTRAVPYRTLFVLCAIFLATDAAALAAFLVLGLCGMTVIVCACAAVTSSLCAAEALRMVPTIRAVARGLRGDP